MIAPVAPHLYRPTLLIGEGAFGADVLRRLLQHSALRGVWARRASGQQPGEARRCDDLALVLLGRAPGEATAVENLGGGNGVEAMRDVLAEIQVLEPTVDPGERVDRLVAIVNALMSATDSAAGTRALIGLDILLIARIDSLETVGLLKRLPGDLLDRLGPLEVFASGLGAGRRLSFIQILDFDDYRGQQGAAPALRDALEGLAEFWERRAAEGRPGCDRIYLSDSNTADGYRDENLRADEASAFLELLLFEDQRTGGLQRLYQAADNKYPLATFGVRVSDWNTALRCRLAAACFAVQWLDHLGGDAEDRSVPPPPALAAVLDRYRPEPLDRLIEVEQLRGTVATAMQSLQGTLWSHDPHNADWTDRVAERCEAALAALDGQIGRLADARLGDLYRDHLAPLGEHIGAAVEADLHHPAQPVSLAAVIGAVEAAVRQLGATPPAGPADPGGAHAGRAVAVARLKTDLVPLHQDYIGYRERRLEPEKLEREHWWWVYAALMALGIAPAGLDLLGRQGLQPPLALALAVGLGFAAFAVAGRLFAHERLVFRVARLESYFVQQEQGRFVAAVRGALGPGGGVRQAAEAAVEQAAEDLRLIVRSEATRELRKVSARLRERRRELSWLRARLRAFLDWQGVVLDGRDQPSDYGPTHEDLTGIRRQHERLADLLAVLELNPAEDSQFRTAQAEQRPFAGWQERYCDQFLQPLRFIAGLAADYERRLSNRDGGQAEGQVRESEARAFAAEIAGREQFGTAFSWRSQEGVPPVESFCLMPAVWLQSTEVKQRLLDWGLDEGNILPGSDRSRAYLIRVLLGVERRALRSAS